MANSTFIQVPHDVTDSISLKRFLNKLIQELDTAFSNRGSSGFTTITSLEDLNTTAESLGSRLVVVEELATSNKALINSLNTKVRNLEAGDTVVTITADYDATSESTKIVCDNLTEISVTLPDPADFLFNSRSMLISITTKNVGAVTILPFDTDLIAGETTQALVVPDESLTFFTDGVDWYVI